ncbi:hypothetical protein CFP56_021124 [Quercus suber]|uniref:Uncharacterized protein n=1 Tax=Quercus suber TaxID=58331 RepID=A0AAW0KE64_QUESU
MEDIRVFLSSTVSWYVCASSAEALASSLSFAPFSSSCLRNSLGKEKKKGTDCCEIVEQGDTKFLSSNLSLKSLLHIGFIGIRLCLCLSQCNEGTLFLLLSSGQRVANTLSPLEIFGLTCFFQLLLQFPVLD